MYTVTAIGASRVSSSPQLPGGRLGLTAPQRPVHQFDRVEHPNMAAPGPKTRLNLQRAPGVAADHDRRVGFRDPLQLAVNELLASFGCSRL